MPGRGSGRRGAAPYSAALPPPRCRTPVTGPAQLASSTPKQQDHALSWTPPHLPHPATLLLQPAQAPAPGAAAPAAPPTPVPVTLITGYLGAGKTTLVNHVLTAKHGYRCAVLLNEIADSADIERALVKEPEVRAAARRPYLPRCPRLYLPRWPRHVAGREMAFSAVGRFPAAVRQRRRCA